MYNRVIKNTVPKKLTTAIINLNGSIIDTMCLSSSFAFQEVFKKHNIEITQIEAHKQIGLKTNSHIAEILKDDLILQQWSSHYGRSPCYSDILTLSDDYQQIQINIFKKYPKTTRLIPDAFKCNK